MGVSTDAYLFFGFEFFDSEQDDEKKLGFDPGQWEEAYAERCGIKDESGFFTKDGELAHKKGSADYKRAEGLHEDYYQARTRCLANIGVTIDTHGSGDAPIYFVAHEKHFERAHRGHSIVIPSGRFQAQDHEIKQLFDFCKRMGIPWQEPRWILASYWG
jgi:hypothetical protein